MTRDLEEIKKGIAQARAALSLLETFIAEYEGRIVNILPREDVVFTKATDDELIAGKGLGALDSLNHALRTAAGDLREAPKIPSM